MDNAKKIYEIWRTDDYFDEATRDELNKIKNDENEISERFSKYLEFGTAGLRGIIGAGTNRMNIYTVALATEAFARYIDSLNLEGDNKSIAISYDSRKFSKEFSIVTALVFASHGIKVYLSDELRPVPMLSYAIRHYGTAGGVMITASHNPAEYNGYKAYGEDGGQMPPEAAKKITDIMGSIDDITSIGWISKSEAEIRGLLIEFGEDLDELYTNMLYEIAIDKEVILKNSDMKIVYTPLHGAGNKPVKKILEKVGFKNVSVVPEQEKPDPGFSTVESPNPEEKSALKMATDLAGKQGADLVLATDPDADRTGLAIRCENSEYMILTGNQIGLLLLDYILKAKKEAGKLLPSSFAVTTIVSSRLTRIIAKHYDIKLFEVLTGFKFIGEIIKKYDENSDMDFVFGFEESFGYLAGKEVRDKDAVVSVMLISEMAASARSEGKTLYDKLQELYRKYGYASEKTVSISLKGLTGVAKIKKAMEYLRENESGYINGIKLRSKSDYLTSRKTDYEINEISLLDLDKSNVLLYEIGGLDWFCIRPSGTEPKLKIYFGIYGESKEMCDGNLNKISEAVISEINSVLEQ